MAAVATSCSLVVTALAAGVGGGGRQTHGWVTPVGGIGGVWRRQGGPVTSVVGGGGQHEARRWEVAAVVSSDGKKWSAVGPRLGWRMGARGVRAGSRVSYRCRGLFLPRKPGVATATAGVAVACSAPAVVAATAVTVTDEVSFPRRQCRGFCVPGSPLAPPYTRLRRPTVYLFAAVARPSPPRRSRVRLWCRHWRYLANRRYHSHCRFCGRGPCFCCYREHRRRRCRCRRSFRCRCCCSSRCCCRRCGVFRSSCRCWCRGRRRGGWLLSRPLPLSLDRLQPSALTLPPPLELEVSGAAAAVVLLLGVPPPRPPPLPL